MRPDRSARVEGSVQGPADLDRGSPLMIERQHAGRLDRERLRPCRIRLDGVNDAFHAMPATEVTRRPIMLDDEQV